MVVVLVRIVEFWWQSVEVEESYHHQYSSFIIIITGTIKLEKSRSQELKPDQSRMGRKRAMIEKKRNVTERFYRSGQAEKHKRSCLSGQTQCHASA